MAFRLLYEENARIARYHTQVSNKLINYDIILWDRVIFVLFACLETV